MKKRKIPLRKCTGCGEMKPKKELIRIVRDPEGNFSVDLTGRANGRGAYLCPDLACFDQLQKNKGLNRSFKQQVPESVFDSLREVLERELK